MVEMTLIDSINPKGPKQGGLGKNGGHHPMGSASVLSFLGKLL
jgi:hypothetical protein